MEDKFVKELNRLQQEYDSINIEINKVVDDYNNKIKQLQAEGQAVVDDMRIKREGLYQAINTIKNLVEDKKVDNTNTNTNTDTNTDTKVINEKPKSRNKNSKLTTDELTSIETTKSKINNKVAKTNSTVTIVDDIPDYLKEEYKK